MRSKHRDKIEQILIEAERKKLQLQVFTSIFLNNFNIVFSKLLSFTKQTSAPAANPSAPKKSKKSLEASISDMLNILVDEDTLRSFGSPDVPVDEVLKMVVNNLLFRLV